MRGFRMDLPQELGLNTFVEKTCRIHGREYTFFCADCVLEGDAEGLFSVLERAITASEQ